MEIVYADNIKSNAFKDDKIYGFYGDVLDMLDMGIDIRGITYNDSWTVKRFLSSIIKHNQQRIVGILKYLDLDLTLLKKKIKDLDISDFKFILLAYLLINNKNILVFDYFEVGLTYKEQKKLINIMRKLHKDGKKIIIISNNLVFMNNIAENIIVCKDGKITFNGNMIDLINCESELIEDNEIMSFIKIANKLDAKLDMTLDSKELLKEIYRSVY